jgi:biopolymer transport protein ExbD
MFKRRKKKSSEVVIQLTALVDAFTILVVFFLVQYSTSPENIKLKEQVNLPVAENSYATESKDNINVVISSESIQVGDEKLIMLQSGKIASNLMHADDSEFISGLHDKITQDEDLSEKKEFQWVLLADEKVPYETIKKTIYTLAISGFTKIKLASTTEGN